MKKTILLISIFLISLKCYTQEYFEGIITFKIELEIQKKSQKDLISKLFNKYGDSLQMFYSKDGNFRRKYMNSPVGGLDTQTYIAQKKELLIKYKGKDEIETVNVAVNSLKLISFKVLDNEFINNLECECYEYIGKTINKKTITLKFCFSNLLKKINIKAFANYNDFFINDFFTKSEKPYLFYSMTTEDFSMKYTAIKVLHTEITKLKINK